MPKNKINAKKFAADVIGGMSDIDLMEKYQITSKTTLDKLLQKLVINNLITQNEINNRSNKATFEVKELFSNVEKETSFKPDDATRNQRTPSNDSDNNTNSNNITYSDSENKDKVKLLLIGFICLIVGYFAGREHIKYEIRTTMQEAAQEFKQNISSVFSGKRKEKTKKTENKPYEPEEDKQESFSVELLNKAYREADYSSGLGSDAITFGVKFINLTGKDIRAFDGRLTFTDMLDNKILSANLAINDPVSSYSPLKWSGQLDYNQFFDHHQRLRAANFENIKIIFEVKKILFDDGTVMKYD